MQGFFNHHQLKSDVNYKIFIAFSKSVAPNERSCGVFHFHKIYLGGFKNHHRDDFVSEKASGNALRHIKLIINNSWRLLVSPCAELVKARERLKEFFRF